MSAALALFLSLPKQLNNHFIPLNVRFSIICRLIMKNTTTMGITLSVVPAINGPYSTKCCLLKVARASCRVIFSVELMTINGHKKSLQLDIKMIIANTARAGFIFGRINFQYIPNSEHPSTLAACRSSSGTTIMNCLVKKMP